MKNERFYGSSLQLAMELRGCISSQIAVSNQLSAISKKLARNERKGRKGGSEIQNFFFLSALRVLCGKWGWLIADG